MQEAAYVGMIEATWHPYLKYLSTTMLRLLLRLLLLVLWLQQ
jgi:hypothetical protein